MGKNTNKTNTQAQAQGAQYVTREELNAQFASFFEQMKGLIATASADAQTCKQTPAQETAQPKAEDEKVWFVKKNGERKLVSAKQAAVWEARRNRTLTAGQKQTVEAIKAGKLLEPERTRKLEKELGVKANSFANTAVSVKQALEAGWKPKASDRRGRKDELASIKAKIRG